MFEFFNIALLVDLALRLALGVGFYWFLRLFVGYLHRWFLTQLEDERKLLDELAWKSRNETEKCTEWNYPEDHFERRFRNK